MVDAACRGVPGSIVLEANGSLTWTPLQIGKSASCPAPCAPSPYDQVSDLSMGQAISHKL